ncbi:MAG: DUF5110 domain-containing protein [Bacteroidetes bacterium]|nr:DUF5110 domain-containing protein [Bacteroidota bacterium]
MRIRILTNRLTGFALALALMLLTWPNPLSAQVIRIEPPSPAVNIDATLYYDASQGNKALKNYSGDVYLHTGVITNKSLDGHDWKYVVGNWGKPDKLVLMKREGPNLYSFKLQIKSFYKLGDQDVAQQLAFVFRNEDGTIVGKTTENEDITIPVNGYKVPEKKSLKIVNEKRKVISIQPVGVGWNVTTDHGMVTIRTYADNILGIGFSPSGNVNEDSSHAVVAKPVAISSKSCKVGKGEILKSGDISVYANSDPYYLAFIYKGDTILQEEDGFFQQPGNSGVRFRLGKDEAIYGAGERALPMNRRGNRFSLYNRPFYGYEYGAAMLNYSMPLTFSSRKYAVLFDNPAKGYVDIGKTESNVQEWGTSGGTLRYFVIAGKDWQEITKSYTALTGRQSLPPRWVFGNLQSRMAYRNQLETDSIVSLMRKKNFPVDAVILDFYWFGDSIQGHLGNLDWYRKAWPDPVGMINKFKKEGIKTILITEPYVIDTVANYADAASKGVFVTDSLGHPYKDKQFYFGTGSLIDIFKPEARDWFWSKYKKQIDNGVAAWWGDLGEPESHPADIHHSIGTADQVHNIFGHYWDRMLFEKYKQNYPGTRLFHLQRSGFAGSQRYSAFPWTGDVSRSWGGLKAQLPLLLTMSMSGLGYIHSDAGGFAQGLKDDELYTRWLQFAVFTPILRPHGSGIPSEPVYWSEKTQDIVRKYMELRYSLLPYNYTLAWENATSGTPLMRPLFYNYPGDTTAVAIGDQYMWGDHMMVVAITDKGATSKKIYLPAGNWIDFNTAKQYKGGEWIDYQLSIENIPVFVKTGSFIPMTKPVHSTDLYTSEEYIVRYYPSQAAEFTQYEDDGTDNQAMAKGKFELIHYEAKQDSHIIVISLSKKGNWTGMPVNRKMTFKVFRDIAPAKVLINGKPIPVSHSTKAGVSSWQLKDGWLDISFSWNGQPVKIQLTDAVSNP